MSIEVVGENFPLLGKEPRGGGEVRKQGDGEYSFWGVVMIFTFPALGGFLFGYDIGATSMTLVQMQSSSYSGTLWYDVVASSSVLQGVITSIGVGGAMLGSLACFAIADAIGRRYTLLIAATQFFLGSMVEFISGVPSWPAGVGLSVLIVGRLIYGIGCGFAMHGAPAYIGEMAPPSIRGLLVALKEAAIVLGMLSGYVIGYLLAETSGGWRYVYGGTAIISLLMGLGVAALPPSARWLVLQNRPSEAIRSIRFVLPLLPQGEVDEILMGGRGGGGGKRGEGGWDAIRDPVWRPALVAGIGLVCLQQVTGQPSVLYYAATLFDDVGMSSLASVLTGAFKLAATLLAVWGVDKHGRRSLLLIGCALMLVALLTLGVAFAFPYVSVSECNGYTTTSTCGAVSQCAWSDACVCDGVDDCTCCGSGGFDAQKVTILTALFVYIGGYQVGFGPVVWLLIAELFPLELRGKAISMAVVSNFFWNMLVTFFFPVEIEWIGTAATFFIFAGLTMFSIYFIHKNVPETKGLTLEQIENIFRQRVTLPQAHA